MMALVGIFAACGFAALSLRTLAYALAQSVDVQPSRSTGASRTHQEPTPLSSRQVAMLAVEIAMSVGVAMLILGLAATAALPGHLLIGALLAQVAVMGSLIAPPLTVQVGGIGIRPAAFALGIAQIAQFAFFVTAIRALM